MPFVLRCSTDNEYYGKEINTSSGSGGGGSGDSDDVSEGIRKWIITSAGLIAGVVGMVWIWKKAKP